ncbi:hypothetical protein TSMEX_005378 [Taenia solium]|eukprot:TsM_000963200 transcript=TsM_000963200 gene=TsM_000963200
MCGTYSIELTISCSYASRGARGVMRGRDIFQEALKNHELVLQVLPYTGKIACCVSTVNDSGRCPSPPVLPTCEAGAAVTDSEKPTCGLVMVVDHSGKAKEVASSKPGPPPPPRRSPHTALSQQQQQRRQQTDEAPAKAAPILPPRQKQEAAQSQALAPGLEIKTVRLRKGASGLGFSLTSRDQHQRKPNCLVFIKNILPGGAALLDGKLKPGDRLLMRLLGGFLVSWFLVSMTHVRAECLPATTSTPRNAMPRACIGSSLDRTRSSPDKCTSVAIATQRWLRNLVG